MCAKAINNNCLHDKEVRKHDWWILFNPLSNNPSHNLISISLSINGIEKRIFCKKIQLLFIITNQSMRCDVINSIKPIIY